MNYKAKADAYTRLRVLDLMAAIEDETQVMIHEDIRVSDLIQDYYAGNVKPVTMVSRLANYLDELRSR